jgi:hypothetical protein
VWGRANDCRRMLVPGFTFSPKSAGPSLRAMVRWAWLEVTEGWRSWFAAGPKTEPSQQPASAAAPAAP